MHTRHAKARQTLEDERQTLKHASQGGMPRSRRPGKEEGHGSRLGADGRDRLRHASPMQQPSQHRQMQET
jgi:hypothetical protein